MRTVRPVGGGSVRIDQAPDPVPGPGEVIVRTVLSALCGSELHNFRGSGWSEGNMGHEAVGVVESLGEGVTSLRIGQRVGACALAGCGQCEECQAGRNTWCPDRVFYGSMHAERFLIAEQACHPLPDDISWEAGVLLSGDGLGVPYHTSRKLDRLGGSTVAVFGAGPIGLGNVLVQAALGRDVVAIDLQPERLEIALQLGACATILADGVDVVHEVRRLAGGKGADICIEAAGRPETALACFEAVRAGGTVVFNGEQGPLPLSPSDHFIRRDITAVGSWFYHFGEFPEMVALQRDGLAAERLITHRFDFTDAEQAYQEFAAGRTGKVVLLYPPS